MAKKELKKVEKEPVKEPVKEVVEEVKEEKPVEVVDKAEGKKTFLHETGQLGYIDENDNFVPL